MKKIMNSFKIATLSLVLPISAFAQGSAGNQYEVLADGGGGFGLLLANIVSFTNGVLIPFILGIGFLVFVWGMFRYFIVGGANDDAKEQGKSLMVYATLGFVFIIIFWGIVNLLASSTGLEGGADDIVIPSAATIER
jgi:hypothetical protein